MGKQVINNTDTNPDNLVEGANKINQMMDDLYTPNFGLYNYNHGGANQSLTANIWTPIKNDGAGQFTYLDYVMPNVDIYNTTNNNLDFSDLVLGDSIDIRFDGIITTNTANESVSVRVMLDVGGIDVPLEFIRNTYKNSGTYPLFGSIRVDMLTEEVRSGVSRLEIMSDASSTLDLNGWNIKVNKRLKG